MSKNKDVVASPIEYPGVAPRGYYAVAFKKTKQEKQDLKDAKRNHKAMIDAEYGNQFNASQRKKIMNPTNIRLD